MKANKNFLFICTIALALVFGLSSMAYTICWQDSYGSLWKIKLGDYTLTKTSAANGYRQVSFTCNGSHIVPIAGSFVRNSAGDYVFGVWSTGNEPTVCQGVSWHAVLDGTTLNGSGGWQNQAGSEGTFTLTKIPCSDVPSVLSADEEFDPVKVFNPLSK
ncbi:MAG: hypothetical protein V1832_00125 [Nitrospirota bacterium]